MAMGTRKQQERQEGLWIAGAGVPRSGGAWVLRAVDRTAGAGWLCPLCGGALPAVLCGQDGAAEPGAGSVLPAVADGVFGGAGFRAGDRLAGGGLGGAGAGC